jgi:2-dehydro-3-deoxygluconokinase
MAKVITMGEIMLRLSTPNSEKFIQADEFDVCYGGGEANVAVSLANYGHDAEFVTAVPNNEIGECAVAALRNIMWVPAILQNAARDLASTSWRVVLP